MEKNKVTNVTAESKVHDVNNQNANVLDATMEILSKYNVEGQRQVNDKIINEIEKRCFNGEYSLRDDDDDSGLNTNFMGGLSLLLLINSNYENSEVHPTLKQIETIRLNKTIVFNHLDEKGYDFSPFVKTDKLEEIFKSKKYYSIEALTWCLSYLIQLRKAIRFKLIEVTDVESIDVMKRFGDALLLLKDGVIEVRIPNSSLDVKVKGGWNFLNECSFPSIYYTAITIEVLSEIDDYVLVRDLDILEEVDPDYELLDFLGAELVKIEAISDATGNMEKRIIVVSKENCNVGKYEGLLEAFYSVADADTKDGLMQNTSRWAWYTYKDQLMKDTFEVDKQYSNDDTFYIMYLLEIITLSYTENYILRSEVEELVETAIFFLDKKITKINSDSINSYGKQYYRPEAEGLEENDDNDRKKINRVLSDYVLYGPSLTPLRIKLGSMYALYFTKYPDKKMAKELELLLENKHESGWFWDNGDYNLVSTEKAIEALTDFFTYYNLYEEKYFNVAQSNEALKKSVKSDLYSEVKKKITLETTEKLNVIHALEIEKQIEKNEYLEQELSETKYKFFHQMEEFVEEIIDKRMDSVLEERLLTIVNQVDEYNRTISCKKDDNHLADAMAKLWISSIFKISGLDLNETLNSSQVRNRLDSDIDKVIGHIVDHTQDAIRNNTIESEFEKIFIMGGKNGNKNS